jgi:hypothetical protein
MTADFLPYQVVILVHSKIQTMSKLIPGSYKAPTGVGDFPFFFLNEKLASLAKVVRRMANVGFDYMKNTRKHYNLKIVRTLKKERVKFGR